MFQGDESMIEHGMISAAVGPWAKVEGLYFSRQPIPARIDAFASGSVSLLLPRM
jgi:CMP-2-keto-3-deoxyoctulosonic acid synthetase